MQACPNCGANMSGQYCYDCGQRDIGERLTTKVFVNNAVESLTELDSKVWRTIRELTLNPGQVVVNYVAGERAKYVNPVKYFITTFSIFLALSIVSGGLEAEIKSSIHINEAPTDRTNPEQQSLGLLIGYTAQDIMREYRNLITFLAIPVFAFFLRWQFWYSGRNYAETLSYVLFTSGHVHLLAIPILLMQWVAGSFEDVFRVLLMFVVNLFASKMFFKLGWGKMLLNIGLSAILYSLAGFLSGSLLIALRIYEYI